MDLRSAAAALLVACLLGGCGSSDAPGRVSPAPAPSPADSTTPPLSSTPDLGADAGSEPEMAPDESPREGIDASHHQGPIDWAQVADHGISFAYLKASEGTGYVDPLFAGHRRTAAREGIAVGGYHYFDLCTDGAAQAAHFIEVLGEHGTDALPPAVDLELTGSCDDPPARGPLLAEVRAFLAAVDGHYSTSTLVYLYPAFEDRYGLAPDLADHPQWVRRIGDRPPRRAWHVWQYDDHGSVPGIDGPADRNLMQPAS